MDHVPFAPWNLGTEAKPAVSSGRLLPVPRQAVSPQQRQASLGKRARVIQRMSSAPLVRPAKEASSRSPQAMHSQSFEGMTPVSQKAAALTPSRSLHVSPAPPNSLVSSFAEEVNTPDLRTLWLHALGNCRAAPASIEGSLDSSDPSDVVRL